MHLEFPIVNFGFAALLASLLSLDSLIHASSPNIYWTHSCQAPDHKHLGHELAFGPAVKRAAVSDVGQAR